jgi:hypothetical protein
LPPTITRLDKTVARNCQKLKSVDSYVPEAETYLYENCPSVYYEYIELDPVLLPYRSGNTTELIDKAAIKTFS